MFKSDSIRPISLGIAKKDNKILVGIGYDKVKKQTFYRALEEVSNLAKQVKML